MTFARRSKVRHVLEQRQPDLTVLLEQVHKPHNLSAILRSCDAVGVLEAHCVALHGRVPTFNDTSASADKWVPLRVHANTLAAISELKSRGMQIVATHLSEQSVDFREVDYTRPSCVLLGAERWGLTPEAAELVKLLENATRRSRSQVAYDEGARLMSRGMKPQAREAFERAVTIDPTNGQAWVVLAERRRVDGDLAGSAVAITHARQSDDVQVRSDAEVMVGLMALVKKDVTGALKGFADAQRILPSSARAYLFEAQAHAQAGNKAAAITALQRGIAAAPGSPELAAALAQLGQAP